MRYLWRALRRGVGVSLLGALIGCASPPSTRVILLPDDDGHVGAVSVRTAGGVRQLDEAYAAVDVAKPSAAPAAPRALGRAPVEAAYARLLRAQPSPPVSFVLHFELDSTTLTSASRAEIGQVLKAARDRRPTEVTVYGHSDALGPAERNLRLSAERANAVARVLKAQDPSLPVQIEYFGETAPMVPTPPGVAEPRNRRAEVVIL